MTQRVKALPASRPTASWGLSGILVGCPHSSDSIVEAQVERGDLRDAVMDAGIMIQEIFEARPEVMFAEHQRHGAAVELLGDFQIVEIADIGFGNLVGQR